MTDSPFSSIVIGALIVGALAVAIGIIISDNSRTYNVANNDTVFSNISASGVQLAGITNTTANTFFGNKTSTSQSTSIDRFVSAAYNTIQIVGYTPGLFQDIIEQIAYGVGVPGYAIFATAGVIAIIIGIAIYLAVGRR